MSLTTEERTTLQRQFEHQQRSYLAARERVEQELQQELAAGWRPLHQSRLLDELVRRAKRLHARRQNWGEGPAPQPIEIECRQCHDAGFVRMLRHPPMQAVTVDCPACGPSRRRRRNAARILERWPVSGQEDLITLARTPFDTRYLDRYSDRDVPPATKQAIRERLDRALAACRRFTETWPEGVLLSLDGSYGAGKTHLLAKIYALAIRSGRSAIYTTGPDLERLVSNFFEEDADQRREELRRDLVETDVLLLDEADRIARRDGNGWTERHLFSILDSRLRAGRSTVLAGNALAERLPGALLSRARAADSLFIDLARVPDARPILGGRGNDRWKEGI